MGTPENEISYDAYANPLAAAVTAREREVLKLVDEAVSEKRVMLAFQPVVQAKAPGKIAFYEGLIRIMDRSGRIIPARDFISVVETKELGRRIDQLALELGLATLQKVPDIRLAVNLSARSVGYPAWMEALHKGIGADETIAERLILEITEESAMILPDLVTAFMSELQSHGITFALDDFGAGQTSFRHLREFYFDILKIDGQFTRDIARSSDNQVIVQSMLAIAQQFEMFTVAEAVENAADAACLSGIGVDCLQGYHYGAPRTQPAWSERQSA